MVTPNEVLDTIHITIHSLRMQGSSYKPTQFEIKVSYLISLLYSDRCIECREVLEQKRKQAENQMAGNVPIQNKSFLDKVLGK